MSLTNIQLGARGEDEAASYFRKKGFTIRDRNFRTKFGEVDLIVEKDNKLHFVEVKTRMLPARFAPVDSITFTKLRHLKKAIAYYLLKKGGERYKLSLDVVLIELEKDGRIALFKHIENIE